MRLNTPASRGDGSRRLRDVVTSPETRAAYKKSGAWDGTTLVGKVRAHARDQSEECAVVDLSGERSHTYAELESDALRVANFLLDVGVERGDVVAVQLPNRYETVVVALAVFKVGAVINPLLPVYRSKELRYMLNIGRSRVMFLPDSYRGHNHVEMVGALAGDAPELTTRVVVPIDGSPGLQQGWVGFESLVERQPVSLPAELELQGDDISELIFSSGTEAEPKAIMHTENTTNFSVRAAWSSLGMNRSDVVWMPSPIGHSTGFNYGVRMALYHGIKLVLQDRWNGAEAARLVQRERCTYTLAATTFVRDVVEAVISESHDLSSMRFFGSGGAPVPPEVVQAAARVGATVLRLYGSTEVLVGTWNRRESPEDKRIHTDGIAIDGVDIQTWNEAGKQVVGEPGEIHTRGPNTCVGFFNDADRTRSTFLAAGWVKSGDLAVLDADGYLTVVGRKKEIIIRGGLNIAPREIEELLIRMDGVRAAAVIGLPHQRLGEIGCACLVVDEGSGITFETMISYLEASGLARFKLPERMELVSALPMTSTGKIQKHLLVADVIGRAAQAPDG